jgi:hypothetical protein
MIIFLVSNFQVPAIAEPLADISVTLFPFSTAFLENHAVIASNPPIDIQVESLEMNREEEMVFLDYR